MSDTIKMIDPRRLRIAQMPCIVFSDNMQSMISWKIKNHSKGNYSHVMWAHSPQIFASQDMGPGFTAVPVEKYMKPKYRLKFVQPILTAEQIKSVYKSIDDRLERHEPYDYLGIIGQRLNLPCIQSKAREFCSEGVAAILKECGYDVDFGDAPTPAHINEVFKQNKDKCRLLGYWFAD